MAGMVVYSFTITTAKVSVLLLYRRIFATQAFRRRTTVIMILCITWSIVAIFTEIFQCRPFSAAFNLEHILTDSCIDLQAYYWGIAISNLLMDFVLLILPLHMVWNLKLPARQKMLLSGVFLCGIM